MKYALAFLLFGIACAYYALTADWSAIRLAAASCAIAFSGMALAYAFIGPRAFLKKPNGELSRLSYLLFAPYHLLNWLSLAAFRRAGKENAFDKICENVYLGCRLSPRDSEAISNLGIKSVLDLTCEFSETPALRQLAYRCIPILDTYAPSLESLKDGAEWIRQQAAEGPVYIHCALGHGRSAAFVAAYLLLSGQAESVEKALDKIKALRPRIGLHPVQVRALDRLSRETTQLL